MDPLLIVQSALVVLGVSALAVLVLGLTIVVQLRLTERAGLRGPGAGQNGPHPGDDWLEATLATSAADDPDALGVALWELLSADPERERPA